MTSDAILEVEKLSKRFGALLAVSEVTVTIGGHAGVTGIIGPNGSGKTTFVHLVTGVLRPTTGTIKWLGRDQTGWPTHRVARTGLARTFQHTMTLPGLTVLENLRIACEAHGSLVTREELMRWEGFSALREYESTLAKDIPFGVARLLGIAIAMSGRPRMLLLDEPAAGLNDQESSQLSDTLRAVAANDTSLVIIDHDMAFLMPLCQRVIVFDAGRLIADDAPGEIRRNPKVIEIYFGSADAVG